MAEFRLTVFDGFKMFKKIRAAEGIAKQGESQLKLTLITSSDVNAVYFDWFGSTTTAIERLRLHNVISNQRLTLAQNVLHYRKPPNWPF
jgi:hypothetical protein